MDQAAPAGIQRLAQTVLSVYLKRTCSRVTSASSAIGVLNVYALYKSTHSLTHQALHLSVTSRQGSRQFGTWRRQQVARKNAGWSRSPRAQGSLLLTLGSVATDRSAWRALRPVGGQV